MVKRALAVDLGSSSVRAIVFETVGPSELAAVPGRAGQAPPPPHFQGAGPSHLRCCRLPLRPGRLCRRAAVKGASRRGERRRPRLPVALRARHRAGRKARDGRCVVGRYAARTPAPWLYTGGARGAAPTDRVRVCPDVLDLASAVVASERARRGGRPVLGPLRRAIGVRRAGAAR